MKTDPSSINSSLSSDDGVQRLRVVNGMVNNWRMTPPVIMAEEPSKSKDQPRPPVYNSEDYAVALKKFTKRTPPPSESSESPQDANDDQSGRGEMTLRQFSSASELLSKLKTDLRVAYPSFVQEFVGVQIDGIDLLLELLKCIQATQSHQQGRAPPPVLRRSLIDEHAALLCLLHCLRCQDSPRMLAHSAAGLYPLAVSTMSNVTKSRITALQLLTKTCESSVSKGHTQVSEAMSTLRLKFGEPVRFQFLIGMIAGSNADLVSTGLKFLNAFLQSAPSVQAKLYIQAEIMQAGLNIELIRNACQNSEAVTQEISTWQKNFIDIENMKKSAEDSKEENLALREKIALLERKIQKLHEEKSAIVTIEKQWKERYNKLLDKLRSKNIEEYESSHKRNIIHIEDEGISSSELEEDIKRISDEEVESEEKTKIIKEESEDEEKEIVPTKLLPQPPRKYIISYCDHDGDEEDVNQRVSGFFDDDDEISENSNYYCTQNTLINKKEEKSANEKPSQLNTNVINKINLKIASPNNSNKGTSSSDNTSHSNSDHSNTSFNYYIQNTTPCKNTDTVRSRDKLDEINNKTSTNNKVIKINSGETIGKINNKTSTNQLINISEPTNQVKSRASQNSPAKTEESYKLGNKPFKSTFVPTAYKNVMFSKQPAQQNYESKIKHHKENADKYSSRDQPMEIQHDKNIILKRSETFHNVQNRIHNYQNVNAKSNASSNPVQSIVKPSIVKPRRNKIPASNTSSHYEDTQSENIKRNIHHQYNIRRSSFDGLFYITANGNQSRSSSVTTNSRENDNVNMINSNYFNYVNIKFNNNNNTNGTTSTASSSKKYKSLEGISDGLESMVDIVMTNNNSKSKVNDARRGQHVYKNIKYDSKSGSLCKLSDLPSGLY